MSVNSADPNVIIDIAYAAFQTHYNVTKQPGWSDAKTHWDTNQRARTLWIGLVKGVIINLVDAQTQGKIPTILIASEAPAAVLPGLRADIPSPGKLMQALKRQGATGPDEARMRQGAAPGATDLVPGLAIGRDTEGDEPEGEHKAVTDAIEAHIRGSDEE